MAKSMFVIRNKGHALPSAFITAALKEFPTAFGYASPQKDTSIHIDYVPADEYDMGAALAEVEKEYHHDTVYYNFVQANEDEINFESMQPFPLVTKDEKNQLCVMLEGEFPKYHGKNEDGEAFTPEWHCCDKFLVPLIEEYWALAGEDLDLFMSMIQKKPAQDKITAELGPRATILFIPAKGEGKATTNNSEGAVRPWGFTSRTITYAAQDNEKPAKTLTMKERAQQKQGTTPPPDTGKPIEPAEVFGELVKKNDLFFMNGKVLMVKPRPGASWKEARTWWNTHSSMPKPLDKDGEVDPKGVYAGFPADKLNANSPLTELVVKAKGGKRATSEQGPAEPDKKQGEQPDKGTPPVPLLIPADQKNAYLSQKKAGKYPTTDIAHLKASLAENPLASAQLGENAADLLMLSPEALNRLPGNIRTCLLHEWRCQILELEAAPIKDKPVDKPGEQPDTGKPLTMKQRAELKSKAA